MAWFIGISKKGFPETFNKVKINLEDFFRYRSIYGPYLKEPKTVAAIKKGRKLTTKNYKQILENPRKRVRGFDIDGITDESTICSNDSEFDYGVENDAFCLGNIFRTEKRKNPPKRKRIWYIVTYPRGGGKIVRGPKKSIWKKKYPGPIQGPYYLEEVRHLMQ